MWIYSADLQEPGSHDTSLLHWNLVFFTTNHGLWFYSLLQLWCLSHRLSQKNKTNPGIQVPSPKSPNPTAVRAYAVLSNHEPAYTVPAQWKRLHKVFFPTPSLYLFLEQTTSVRTMCCKCLIHPVLAVVCSGGYSVGVWWEACWRWQTKCLKMLASSIKGSVHKTHIAECMYFLYRTLEAHASSQAKISKQCTHSLLCIGSFNPLLFLFFLSPLTAEQCRFFTGWRYGRDRRGTMNNCWRYFYSDPLWSPFCTPLKGAAALLCLKSTWDV